MYEVQAKDCFEKSYSFTCPRTTYQFVTFQGIQVDSFKYLGVILDAKLSFTEHVTAVQKKSQQRLHVLRKLRAFYVDPLLLLRLYLSIIEPLLTYCSICYYPALSVKNRNRLVKISHVSAKIIGLPTPKLSEIIDHAILKKARAVATESDHPLSTFFHVLPSPLYKM